MDNRRELNLDDIIEEVRQEYETNAQRSRAEVDAMYQGRVSRLQQDREARLSAPRKRNPNFSSLLSHQYQDLQNLWANQRQQLRNSYKEIQELTRRIQRLQPEIEMARKKVRLLLSNVSNLFTSLVRGDSVQGDVARPFEANTEVVCF